MHQRVAIRTILFEPSKEEPTYFRTIPRECTIKIRRLYGPDPEQERTTGGGVILTSALRMTLPGGERSCVPTGLKISLPEGTQGRIRGDKSLARQRLDVLSDLVSLNEEQLCVTFINCNKEPQVLEQGQQIGELVLAKSVRFSLENS